MTDGTTGFQVAPITEEDMFKVKDILQRAADAIVGMSQLSADVDMLRQTVTGLQADTERLRSQNNALDEALNYSRKARDEQAAKLSEVQDWLSKANGEATKYMHERDSLELNNGQLQIDLDLTRKAKDNAEFKVLELEDKLAVAEGKLAKVAELHKSLFPEPAPEPPKPEPVHIPITEDVATTNNLPDPAPAPLTDTRPDSLVIWESGYIWDPGTLKYWREGVHPKPDGDAVPF